MKVLLIIFIILFLFIILLYFKVRNKIREFSKLAFGTENLFKGIKKEQLEARETPKSLFGMEKLDLPRLNKDFKELNINELKRDAERTILNCLDAIETKNLKKIKEENLKVFINSKLEDLKDDVVSYDNIKIHKTILNRYEKNEGIATIRIHSAIEYIYSINKKSPHKVQTRFELEYIYIIDENKISNVKGIGLNCPNCGAPINSLGDKYCTYCNSGVVDIVKRTWILNNIKEF